MKKIATDTVRKFLKEYRSENGANYVKEYKIGNSVFDVHFRTDLNVDERDAFVRRVVHGSFDMLGQYHEELFRAMFRVTVLQMCTNIPVLALKGEKTDDGDAVLDLNQMDELAVALRIDDISDDRFHSFYARMYRVCERAVHDRKEYLREINSASYAVRDLTYALKGLIDRAGSLINEESVGNLMQYAHGMSAAAENIDKDKLAEKIIELHAEK